ncbi:hypothetical protein C8J57DRAFT_1376293 [Mycena rebaudengoi]|nr:hypothetical protein C8J57DRAFT_1376293 [Mycena rebaudengoi]
MRRSSAVLPRLLSLLAQWLPRSCRSSAGRPTTTARPTGAHSQRWASTATRSCASTRAPAHAPTSPRMTPSPAEALSAPRAFPRTRALLSFSALPLPSFPSTTHNR